MKKHLYYIFALIISATLFFSCEDGIEELPEFPQISIEGADDVEELKLGESLVLKANIQNPEGTTMRWLLNGQEVTTDTQYTFTPEAVGNYVIALVATNQDGDTKIEREIRVYLASETYMIPYAGDQIAFTVKSNESWSIKTIPNWMSVQVAGKKIAAGETIAAGEKAITIIVQENPEFTERSAELLLISAGKPLAAAIINQEKQPELVGYWILSEGYLGQNNAELAWYDLATDELFQKQFAAKNGTALGDTGNDLKLYGSKMYCVVTGPGFGAAATEGTNYIEVINPQTGVSIKRIPFTNASGEPAKPRKIIFEGGKGYVSSYSNELVRLDTASLAFDAHVTLSGTLAEGLCYNDGNIYVCNSGQGSDNKISVVNTEEMKETKVLEVAMNPTGIVFDGREAVYFNTGYPEYKLYKMSIEDESITEAGGVTMGDITYFNDKVYGCYFDWGTYEGTTYEYDTTTEKGQKMNVDLAGNGIRMLMEYHIGTINDSKDLYLTGMGQDVVVLEAETGAIKHTFKTGVPSGSSVVAVYK